MKEYDRPAFDNSLGMGEPMISRRIAVGSSALSILGLVVRSAAGQTRATTPDANRPDPNTPAARRGPQRAEQGRAMIQRMGTATSPEERMKIMDEMAAESRKRALEAMKDQLGFSEEEWAPVKPRLEAVFNLVHTPQSGFADTVQPANDVEQKARELRELLKDEKVPADQIKAKLTAYRAVKQKSEQDLTKARANLREVVTVRQEALLVLNGLLT